jgi:uncharacterized protein YndB with AHSA1/START domain
MASMRRESRHVSVFIDADPDAVYDYASDPALLPEWAAGLAGGIRQEGGRWIADSPFGTVEVRYVPRNVHRVLDHEVVMPDGTVVLNPMRVVADEGGAEVIFTVRRRDGMSEEELAADVAAVQADLERLRRRLESR